MSGYLNCLAQLVNHCVACRLMLVMGASLVVYPAAELPQMALAAGAKLVIVNREATDYDRLASVVVWSHLGDFAREVFARL